MCSPPTSSRLLAALAVVLLASTTATSVLAAALPSSSSSGVHHLARRANSDPRLSGVTRISDGQVEGIERLLNRTANKRCVASRPSRPSLHTYVS